MDTMLTLISQYPFTTAMAVAAVAIEIYRRIEK